MTRQAIESAEIAEKNLLALNVCDWQYKPTYCWIANHIVLKLPPSLCEA
ncbi:MAG: hypothetical protein U0528_13385 [Anaerolineae bacterium]